MSITDLSWSYSENLLISSSIDGTIRLWSLISSDCLCVFEHDDVVSSIKFHPTEHELFLSACWDGRLRLWSISEKKVVSWYEQTDSSFTAIAITSEGQTVVAGTMSGDIVFLDMPDFRYDTQINIAPVVKSLRATRAKPNCKITSIEALKKQPGEVEKIVVGSADSKLRIINLKDKSVARSLRGHLCQTTFFRCDTLDTGDFLLSPSEDKNVYFWDLREEPDDATSQTISGAFRVTESMSKATLDKLPTDEAVVSAIFAPSNLAPWAKDRRHPATSFLTPPGSEPAQNEETIFVVIGDVQGKISVYKNEAPVTIHTVRSMRDVMLSAVKESSDDGTPMGRRRRSTSDLSQDTNVTSNKSPQRRVAHSRDESISSAQFFMPPSTSDNEENPVAGLPQISITPTVNKKGLK